MIVTFFSLFSYIILSFYFHYHKSLFLPSFVSCCNSFSLSLISSIYTMEEWPSSLSPAWILRLLTEMFVFSSFCLLEHFFTLITILILLSLPFFDHLFIFIPQWSFFPILSFLSVVSSCALSSQSPVYLLCTTTLSPVVLSLLCFTESRYFFLFHFSFLCEPTEMYSCSEVCKHLVGASMNHLT